MFRLRTNVGNISYSKKEIHLFINIHEISIFTFRKHILKIFIYIIFLFLLKKLEEAIITILFAFHTFLVLVSSLNLYKITLIYVRLEFNSKIKEEKRENSFVIQCYSRKYLETYHKVSKQFHALATY